MEADIQLPHEVVEDDRAEEVKGLYSGVTDIPFPLSYMVCFGTIWDVFFCISTVERVPNNVMCRTPLSFGVPSVPKVPKMVELHTLQSVD